MCVILTLLYARDILYIQTVHYVHTVCINNKRWSAAAQYGEIALPAFKQYYGPRTGVVAALLVRYNTVYQSVQFMKICILWYTTVY